VLGAFEPSYNCAPVRLLDDAVQGSLRHLAAVADLLGVQAFSNAQVFPLAIIVAPFESFFTTCNKKDAGIGMSRMYDYEYFKDLGYIGDKNTRQLRRVTSEEYSEIQKKKETLACKKLR
jgi:hypothetical protein